MEPAAAATAAPSQNATYPDSYATSSNHIWTLLWVVSLCAFLSLPFCASTKRRRLCLQRIRERRWVPNNESSDEDDWYAQAFRRRQEERRQQMQAEQEHFQITKTQEDEIREQYLNVLLGKYSKTLAESDIHEKKQKLEDSLTVNTLPHKSSKQQQSGKGVETESDTDETTLPSTDDSSNLNDIETPASLETRKNSDTSEDDGNAIEEMDVGAMNEVVDVPLPAVEASEASDDTYGSALRQVPNGCAICFSQFLAKERISWSSNKSCPHVFHHDCLVHWFHEVGRKVQKRRYRQQPDMSEAEALDLISAFPKQCPCCRQTFCVEVAGVSDTV